MTTIKQALKQAKAEGLTSIKLNSTNEELTKELIRIVIPRLRPATKQTTIAIEKDHPEYYAKSMEVEPRGEWMHWGSGCNSKAVHFADLKFYRDVSNLPYGLHWTQLF